MFKTATKLAGKPFAAFQRPTELTGWNRAWRRYMTSPAGRRIQSQLTHQTFSLGRATPSRIGSAATRARSTHGATSFHPGVRAMQRRGFRFSPWSRSQKAGEAAEKPLSLTARLKKLSKEYGKAAVGVYFALSILDFPFFFLLVKAVGAERIGKSVRAITMGTTKETRTRHGC